LPACGNLLGQVNNVHVNKSIPVILLVDKSAGARLFCREMFMVLASIIRRSRIVDCVEKPLAKSGPTLDIAIKYVLAWEALQDHPQFGQLVSQQPALIGNLLSAAFPGAMAWATPYAQTAAGVPSESSFSTSASKTTVFDRAGGSRWRRVDASKIATGSTTRAETWLTVTQAAELLMDVVSGIDFARAKSRVSIAADRGKFLTNGKKGSRRRIELNSFNTWRFKERDKDLRAADEHLL